jgi:DnaK suppressor protein
MPKAKQQDPAEAPQAEVTAQGHANGASRRRAVPAVPPGTASAHDKLAGDKGAGDKVAPDKAVHRKPARDKKLAVVAPAGGQMATAPRKAGTEKARIAAPESKKAGAGKAGAEKAGAEKVKRARPARTTAVADRAVSGDAGGEPDEARDMFVETQRALLVAERYNYTRQAEELRAQAEALALEHEPGDVQFDEEGGEGGTANVDRELDLHLSAQAHAAVEEIDAALLKIAAGSYGSCESCGSPIPRARLEALPHARLCVSCKSGGLTARRQ